MTITVHNITIDGSNAPAGAPRWSADRYERIVRRNLVYVFNSPVGHAIIPQITRRLRIVPEPVFGAQGAANATPHDGTGARARGSTAFQCSRLIQNPPLGAPFPGQPPGTGVGSDVTIQFTPASQDHDPTDRIDGWLRMMPRRHLSLPAAFSDEVLCHELAHAIRMMRGVQHCTGIGAHYGTFEEFCAVEVANVYASCRHRPVRGEYFVPSERTALLDPFGAPTRRQRQESGWIEQMRREQPGFCDALSRIPRSRARYNPFRRPPSRHVRYADVW